jgi:Uma2 family endonuclease
MGSTAQRSVTKTSGKPAWELAECFPVQGRWREWDYLSLDEVLANQRIELADGFLEFLDVPTKLHEKILQYLYHALFDFVRAARLGVVHFAGTRAKLRDQNIRMPDVLFLSHEKKGSGNEDYYLGADLVMEVVSKTPKDRKRDLVEKRADYAAAGIQEYWIIDPELKQITVLSLQGKKYQVHGVFKKGQCASSPLLQDFAVDVSEALAGLKQ